MVGSGNYKLGKSKKVRLRRITTEKEISIVDGCCGFKEKFPSLNELVDSFIEKNNLPPILSKLKSSDFSLDSLPELPSLVIVYGGDENITYHFIVYNGISCPGVIIGKKKEAHYHRDYTLEGKINKKPIYLHYEVGAGVFFEYKDSKMIATSKANLVEIRKDLSHYWFGM